MARAGNLGERRIIEIIWEQLERDPRMSVPFGDDVSATRYRGKNLVVLNTDMLVGKTDIPPMMSYRAAARKAIVMNVSDFAAKGIKPIGIITSLGIPRNMTRKDIVQIGRGLNSGAREYNTYVLGGDTNETEDLIISITVFGLAREGSLMLRNGATPGDILATTGDFGLTSAGLKILIEKLHVPPEIRRKILESVLKPHARLREGIALAKTGAITASIDSSDGLAWCLHEIGKASNVGFTIENLPIAREAYEFAKKHNLDPLELGFYGGEEYELVFTVKPKQWKDVRTVLKEIGGNAIRIGRAIEKEGLFLLRNGRSVKIEEKGFEHFG